MTEESAREGAIVKRPLRLLFVEDDPADLELCLRAFRKASFDFCCDPVSTSTEFVEKLASQEYDAVLADYNLSGWTGLDALTLLRAKSEDIPFLLVTGALGEEKAVECLKNGVDDYVLKDRLGRLPLAVSQALEKRYAGTERARGDALLRESEERFRTLAEATTSPIFIYQGVECRYANRAAEEVTGYTRKELLAMNSWELVHPDSRDVLIERGLARLQGTNRPYKFELKILAKGGEAKWLEVTIEVVQLDGKPAGLFTGFDITERKFKEQEMLHMVMSDPLTGLANYRRLVEVFNAEAKRSHRTGRWFSLMLLDLDGLKKINDEHGHLTGSRALCRVANILRNHCRESDVAVRHGGDEFAVILPETGLDGAQRFARRICERLTSDGQRPLLSASVGSAVYPQDGQTYEDLFAVADRALYEMKAQGGAGCRG